VAEDHQTLDDDENNVRDNQVKSTCILHVHEVVEVRQDTMECEDPTYQDYEDNHFLKAKVKEEFGNFFVCKDEAKRICVVYLFVSVQNANPVQYATSQEEKESLNPEDSVTSLTI
jgi:hypothetical protein